MRNHLNKYKTKQKRHYLKLISTFLNNFSESELVELGIYLKYNSINKIPDIYNHFSYNLLSDTYFCFLFTTQIQVELNKIEEKRTEMRRKSILAEIKEELNTKTPEFIDVLKSYLSQ